jgi:hypothetical protein
MQFFALLIVPVDWLLGVKLLTPLISNGSPTPKYEVFPCVATCFIEKRYDKFVYVRKTVTTQGFFFHAAGKNPKKKKEFNGFSEEQTSD